MQGAGTSAARCGQVATGGRPSTLLGFSPWSFDSKSLALNIYHAQVVHAWKGHVLYIPELLRGRLLCEVLLSKNHDLLRTVGFLALLAAEPCLHHDEAPLSLRFGTLGLVALSCVLHRARRGYSCLASLECHARSVLEVFIFNREVMAPPSRPCHQMRAARERVLHATTLPAP